MIQLIIGGIVSATALMLLYLWAEDTGVSVWYGIGAAVFATVLIVSGIADLREHRDDRP